MYVAESKSKGFQSDSVSNSMVFVQILNELALTSGIFSSHIIYCIL